MGAWQDMLTANEAAVSPQPASDARTAAPPIRMRRTVDGSLDGRNTQTYTAGETYQLPGGPMHGAPGLREVFLREGWAEEVALEQPEEASLSLAPTDSLTPRRCQATTGSGAQCKRDAVDGSDFCALPAHRAQGA